MDTNKHKCAFLTISSFTILSFISCKQKEIKYTGLNDLVVGIQRITLYENDEFYLEMGLGGTEGTYKMKEDTVLLNYYDKPSDTWPEKFIMRDNYFESINADSLVPKTKIDRVK